MRRSLAVLTLVCAACSGGGGDDTGPVTPPPTPTIAVTMSRGCFSSGATWTLAVPNFAGVSGFNSAWALANASTSWSLTALGGLFAPGNNALGFGEGGTFRSASRTGTVSP